ncbi:MAG: hypothetical protein IJE07_10520 [Clostridia bacterium]|nr:hypothetical protein [Clostridia bacterium]
MKKLVSLLLSAILLLSCLPVLAEEAAPESGSILAVEAAYMGLSNMSAQFKGGESSDKGCLGLQPAAEGDGFADGYIMFPVEVTTAGAYEITVRYAAKAKDGQTRCADLIVNDGERIHLPIVGQADWNVYADAKVTVYLAAGMNTLTLKNVEGFDNSTWKAINVDFLAWEFIAPAADEGRILAVDAEYAHLNDMNPQFKGGESSDKGVLGLQPTTRANGKFAESRILFTVVVSTAGTYEITVRYAAKAKEGQIRCCDMIVNDGERIHLPIVGQVDWDVYMPATVTVELQQGLNEIKLTNVEGYDNSTYKSINVDYLAWKPVPAEEPVAAE